MISISRKFWEFIQKSEKWKIMLFVFSGAFLLRLPTVFMDFVHIDVVTTYLLVKRDLAGLAFNPNKGWLYHYLYKYSVLLFGDTPASFHFTGIMFLLATMGFIYLLGKKIYNDRAGLIAAMFYGFMISSFNTEYLATNGEVIYNLFFTASFFFFYLVFQEKKFFYIIPLLGSVVSGLFVKQFVTLYAPAALLCFLALVMPLWRFKTKKTLKKYYIITVIIIAVILAGAVLDWNFSRIIFTEYVRGQVIGMKNYVANRGFDPLLIIGKLLWRGFHFTLYHSIIWIPGIITITRYFKSGDKDEKQGYLVFITIFLFASVFMGGARLSVHYFIPVLPVISILSSSYVLKLVTEQKRVKLLFRIFAIPVLFFFAWNLKDVYIRHFNPDLKHNESSAMFLFRAVVIGSQGEYLLPHKSVIPAIDYLKNNTEKNAKIMIWPMGTEVAYFSGRETVEDRYWYNETALYAIVRNEKGHTNELKAYEDGFIGMINRYRPDCFVDVGSTEMIRKSLIFKKKDDPAFYFNLNDVPMIRFGSFGSLDNFPEILAHLNKNYKFEGNYGDARVWKKIVN